MPAAKKRRKIRFRKGQDIFVLAEDKIKKTKSLEQRYEDDYSPMVVRLGRQQEASWVELWQVASTRKEVIKQIHEYADLKIAEAEAAIVAVEKWKGKYK